MEISLPKTIDIECQVIADFIGTPEYRNEILKVVTEPMFNYPPARVLWRKMVNMHNLNQEIDMVTMMGVADGDFFTDKILNIIDDAPLTTIRGHSLALVDGYIKTEAYNTSMQMIQAINEGSPSDDILGIYKRMDDRIKKNISAGQMVSLDEALEELFDDYEKGVKRKIPTSYPTIDDCTHGGFSGGQLIVVGARPSAGKTSLAMDMAMKVSKERSVCFFTIEMTEKDLAQRMLIGTGEVDAWDIMSEKKDWDKFWRALDKAKRPNLFISRKCNTLSQIENKIITMHQEGKCDIAYIDYLQIIRGVGRDLREKMTNITGRLKQLALELEIPIVLMGQLNRDSSRDGRRPYSSDLKESGSTEQDADIVILLERPREGETENRIDMYLDKNRNGRYFPDVIRLQGSNGFTNFYELTQNYYDE